VRPGLAEAWDKTDQRAWTLTIGRDSGGGILTAERIAQLMKAAVQDKRAPGIDSVQAMGERQLQIYVSNPTDSLPPILADAELLIYGGLAGERADVFLIPARGELPVIELKLALDRDARDALDHGADLIVSRDPALIDYATGQPMFHSFALPWSRTYVLLQPAGVKPLPVARTEDERRSLAQDAVQVDARGAEPLTWLSEGTSCPKTGPQSATASTRVAYLQGDAVGRALAERLVALAGTDSRMRALGMERAAFEASLQTGAELAYIWAVPRRTLNPCRELAGLAGGMRVVPLIDTRARAIVRRGSPPLTVDWDGVVRLP
jgi:hypothetical protein